MPTTETLKVIVFLNDVTLLHFKKTSCFICTDFMFLFT